MEPPINNEAPPKKLKTDDSCCCRCKRHVRKSEKARSKRIKSQKEADDFFINYEYSIAPHQVLCSKCFMALRREKSKKKIICIPPPLAENSSQRSDEWISSQSTSQESQHSIYSPDMPQEIEFIHMQFDRVVSTHSYCFLCKNSCAKELIDVPLEARLQVFVQRRLFVPKRNRCCSSHLIRKQFYLDEIPRMDVHCNESFIDVNEIRIFLDKLSNNIVSDIHGKVGEFSLSDERITALTGYSWDSIHEFKNMFAPMRKSHNRDITQAVVMFLIKLRSGSSDAFIAAILNVTETVVNESINSVLQCLRTHVLPRNFGFQNYSREFLLTQKAPIAGMLFEEHDKDSLLVICDGTYLRHQKSANNSYQRKSFSGQKKTPLCKPFTVCTSNGFVIDLEGPFEANLNDAEILRKLLQDPNGLITILKRGDVFILDRGFRDVVSYLEELGFTVLMPALKGKRKQLSTEESNESRFVTKLRWVVEAVHGIVSQKCELLHKIQNNLLPNAGTYCKSACLLFNLFGKRLNSDTEQVNEIVRRMKHLKAAENELAIMVAAKNYGRKTKPFESASANDLDDFPQLSEEELKLLFTGTYQLKQAISYLGELLDAENQLQVKYLIEEKGILKLEVRSRHINSKTYKCFVSYEPYAISIDGITGYCCDCANGLRTIGCCSHVAAMIYYLSHGRYLSRIIRPAEKLTYLFQIDNIIPIINEDSDED